MDAAYVRATVPIAVTSAANDAVCLAWVNLPGSGPLSYTPEPGTGDSARVASRKLILDLEAVAPRDRCPVHCCNAAQEALSYKLVLSIVVAVTL